jgi:hypothetical protein
VATATATFIAVAFSSPFSVAPVTAAFVTTATFVPAALIAVPVMPMAMSAVLRLVFSRPYKVDRTVAGIVFAAMTRPILRMAGRYMQIDGTPLIVMLVLDDHRLCIDNRGRRCITDLYFSINARGDFTADSDVDDRSSRLRGKAAEQER